MRRYDSYTDRFISVNKGDTKTTTTDRTEYKRGKWIESSDLDMAWGKEPYTCSNCGRRQKWESNFCPNCGADMRGENDD